MGFQGSARNATWIIEQSADVVWVEINYRMNVFGFLGAEQLRLVSHWVSAGTGALSAEPLRLVSRWVSAGTGALSAEQLRLVSHWVSAGSGIASVHTVPAVTLVSAASGRLAFAQCHLAER